MTNKQACRLALGVILIGTPLIMNAEEGNSSSSRSGEQGQGEADIKVVYEVFSLPMGKAAALQRSGLSDADFYSRLVTGLKDESVKLESFLVVRGLSGQLLETIQAEEYTYPYKFESPELPTQVIGSGKRKDKDGREMTIFPVTPARVSFFERKRIGEFLELEANAKENGRIDLRVSPSRIELVKKDSYGQGVSKLEIPRFSSPRIRTAVEVQSGKVCYLGTVSSPEELQPKEGEKIVSFAFITATEMIEGTSRK